MNQNYRFFANYHIAAKDFSNGNMETYGRLMYVLNSYGIEGEILEDLSPTEKLFLTSVKASIDLSLTLSESARKKGAKKGAEQGAKNEEEKERDKEYEYEKEEERENINLNISASSSDFIPDIKKFISDKKLFIYDKSVKKINKYMITNGLPVDYLNFVFKKTEEIKSSKNPDEFIPIFLNKATELYEDFGKENKSSKPKKKIEHPTFCPDCNTKLSRGKIENTWICKPCGKWYDLDGKGNWKWGS